MNDKIQLKVIKLIKKTSGTNAKKKLLKYVHPTLLKYTYNPYMKYYIHPNMNIVGQGSCKINSSISQLLKDLNTRELSGIEAKEKIVKYIISLSPESAELFKMMLNKTMDFGLNVKSINQVFPKLIPVHKVMLAKLYDEKHLKLPCYVSPKIDGVRGIYKDGTFYSRNGHAYKGLKHLTEVLKGFPSLDGELDIPGISFQKSSGLIRNNQNTPDAQFNVFDLPDSSLPFLERLLLLEDMIPGLSSIMLVPHHLAKTKEEMFEYYNSCRDMKYEGIVIKTVRHKYTNGRPWHWMKLKPKGSIDKPVLKLLEGKGKYECALGKVVIAYKDSYVKVGSGFTDAQRRTFWKNPALILGRMIEVEYMEETDDGSLRHPVFKGLRPDKE